MAKGKAPEVFVISKGPPTESLKELLRSPPRLALAAPPERPRQVKAADRQCKRT